MILGGPLFDLAGRCRLIGIHSRIGPSLANNHHVQTDQFKNDWDKLVAGEWVDKPAKVNHAYIGVVFPDDDEEARPGSATWLRAIRARKRD